MSNAKSKHKDENEPINEQASQLTGDKKEVPSSAEIGLEASRKGNFQMARKLFRAAIEQLEGQADKQPRLVELMINIADSYLNEGVYDSAKTWYSKALDQGELFYGKNSLQTAALLVRQAEISVLLSDMVEFQKYLDAAEHIYLMAKDTDLSMFLHALTDLSWALCVQGYLAEVKPVNALISQIKQLEEEDKLAGIAA